MNTKQREKLFAYENRCMSIGITEDGVAYDVLGVPWEHTANAFNMRTPDIYLERKDLDDPEIRAKLNRFIVNGCYILVPLEDYSFLKEFPEIQDLHIRHGEKITDLSFMSEMREWFMLLLEGAKLKNLDDIYPVDGVRRGIHSFCMAFYDCEVEDVGAIEKKGMHLSELIIWNEKTEEEYQKWKSVPANTFRYYEK